MNPVLIRHSRRPRKLNPVVGISAGIWLAIAAASYILTR